MKKCFNSTKESSRRLSKDKIKKGLIDLLDYDENINTEDLHAWANRVESYEKAMKIIQEHEDIIKTNKKNITFFA